MEKLSSGFRINRAGDDAAGLAISEKMRGQIRGLKQAARNAQDGISLIQTAEGALNETHAILQRMRELATQAATDTNIGTDRAEIQKEIDQLATEITRIADTTEFNTQNLLGGDFKAKFHIGANQGQNTDLKINAMDAKSLLVSGTVSQAEAVQGIDGLYVRSRTGEGLVITFVDGAEGTEKTTAKYNEDTNTITVTLAQGGATADSILEALQAVAGDAGVVFETDDENYVSGGKLTKAQHLSQDTKIEAEEWTDDTEISAGINVSSQRHADQAIKVINNAIETVSTERSMLGAMQNRLEHTIANLGTSAENLQAAESRIRDLDMAEEIMAFTKNNILQQAATAMLAQANMAPQSVLQLLG